MFPLNRLPVLAAAVVGGWMTLVFYGEHKPPVAIAIGAGIGMITAEVAAFALRHWDNN